MTAVDSSVKEHVAALDLLQANECTAMCLLGRESSDECTCRCGGQWHGVLLLAALPDEPPRHWWVIAGHAGWSTHLLDDYYPIGKSQSYWDRRRNSARTANEPAIEIRCRPKGTYTVIFDAITVQQHSRDDDRQWEPCGSLVARLQNNLLVKRRCTGATYPGTWVSVEGLRNSREAQVTAALLGETWHGNPEGACRALLALEEGRDAVAEGAHPSSLIEWATWTNPTAKNRPSHERP